MNRINNELNVATLMAWNAMRLAGDELGARAACANWLGERLPDGDDMGDDLQDLIDRIGHDAESDDEDGTAEEDWHDLLIWLADDGHNAASRIIERAFDTIPEELW